MAEVVVNVRSSAPAVATSPTADVSDAIAPPPNPRTMDARFPVKICINIFQGGAPATDSVPHLTTDPPLQTTTTQMEERKDNPHQSPLKNTAREMLKEEERKEKRRSKMNHMIRGVLSVRPKVMKKQGWRQRRLEAEE